MTPPNGNPPTDGLARPQDTCPTAHNLRTWQRHASSHTAPQHRPIGRPLIQVTHPGVTVTNSTAALLADLNEPK